MSWDRQVQHRFVKGSSIKAVVQPQRCPRTGKSRTVLSRRVKSCIKVTATAIPTEQASPAKGCHRTGHHWDMLSQVCPRNVKVRKIILGDIAIEITTHCQCCDFVFLLSLSVQFSFSLTTVIKSLVNLSFAGV